MDAEEEATCSTNIQSSVVSKKRNDEEEEYPKIEFKCSNCSFNEECDYFGVRPPFANKIKFYEDCYIMKDPFAPSPAQAKTTNSEYFIVLGAHCTECKRTICRGQECSFFYLKTYCLSCVNRIVQIFPVEVQSKIKKQISMNQSK